MVQKEYEGANSGKTMQSIEKQKKRTKLQENPKVNFFIALQHVH